MGVIGQPIFFGSSGLNFEVLGGTTEPTPTKDFAIWVNTSSEITRYSFGYSHDDHTPVDGDVFFRTGLTWSNYAIRSDALYGFIEPSAIPLSPLWCMQYSESEGKWVGKTFQLWYNDQWNDVDSWAVFCGKDNSAPDMPMLAQAYLPGGLQVGHFINQGTTATTNNYRMLGDRLQWAVSKEPGNSFNIEPGIDLTNYNYICFDIQCLDRYSDQSKVTVGVGTNQITNFAIAGAFAASVGSIWNTKRTTYRVDISNLSGLHYPKISAYNTTGYLYNCWLEV